MKYETDFSSLIVKLHNEVGFSFPTPLSIESFLINKSLDYDKLELGDETNILKGFL